VSALRSDIDEEMNLPSDSKKKFVCPATGLETDLKHCRSYGNGAQITGVEDGCKYLEDGECIFE